MSATRCQKIERTADRIEQYGERLQRMRHRACWQHGRRQVDQLGKLLESYSFHSVLNRGFALVRDQDGHPVLAAAETQRRRHDQHRIRRRPHRRQGDRRRRLRTAPGRRRRAAATAAAAIRGRCCRGETS